MLHLEFEKIQRNHLKFTALTIQDWYFLFPIALLLKQPGFVPGGWLWAVPSALWEPHPCSELDALCSQHGCPELSLQQVDSSSPGFQNYLFSLYLVLSLAVQPELLGLKAARACLQKWRIIITWGVVLRCELWSSGWMFTRSPVVSLCAVQSIVHF